ncbi:hypothetical protein BJV82DRAFT_711136 [Fennellomyces sp. T-0311]|nr:hypothetical protein BJV82DRAFT_711136 [Fennellomyces sp. T-0311]
MVQHENVLVSRVCEAIARRTEDDITQTPGLSPPSSPELAICPDKGIEYDDDDDDSFQEHRSEPARGYKPMGEDQESIDYFYHDFDADNNEIQTTTSTTERKIDDLHKPIGPPLDLNALAQQLYENRLSVLHPRQSKLVLTDQDEIEFEKLMQRQTMTQRGYACEKVELNDHDTALARIKEALRLSDASLSTQQSVPREEGSDKILVEEEEEPSIQESAQESDQQSDLKSTSTKSNASRSSRFKEIDLDLSDIATDIIGKHVEPQPSRSMSLNLFGSLRNRARSHSTPSIKGLMRNLSTGSVISQRPQKKRSHSTLSPAAMAVLKHTTETQPEPDTKSKGKRMLSQLLNSARLSRKPTKKVNMNEATSRAQIVRRTIIYVPPDSENFMKHIEHPPSPALPRPVTPDSDEGVPKQQKATIVTRQASVKRQFSKRRNNNNLEGVELREMSDGSVVWGVVKKQGNRKSFYAAESKVEHSSQESSDEEDEDEEQIEERVLALMGLRPDLLKDYPSTEKLPPPPIPKRSPHRQQATYVSSYSNRRGSSTTDIYYAPDATLPSLLQMISDSQESPRENPTVEEQLDEVMRSLGYTDGQLL